MNPEIEQLIRENNKMLKSIRRSLVASRIAKFIYWGIIIVLAYIAYTFIQPYLVTLMDAYEIVEEQSGALQELRRNNGANIEDILDALEN